MNIFCIHCGSELSEQAKFCPKCGEKIESPKCPSCGKETDYKSGFCIYCGHALKVHMEIPLIPPDSIQEITEEGLESPVLEQTPPQKVSPVKDPSFMQAQVFHSGGELSNDSTGDVTNENLSRIVGYNTKYYLPEFEKARRGDQTRFNWAAFLFGPAFCYYRKYKALCWHLFKKFYILMASSLIAIALTTLLVSVVSPNNLIVCGIIGLLIETVIQIYGLVCAIRCGRQFNLWYYRICRDRAVDQHTSEKDTGISLANGILFNLAVGLCASVLTAICGAVISFTLFGGALGAALDPSSVLSDLQILSESDMAEPQNLYGRWNLVSMFDGTTTISRETLSFIGVSESEIDKRLSETYVHFFYDDTFVLTINGALLSGSWSVLDGDIYLTPADSSIITAAIQNNVLSIQKSGLTIQLEHAPSSATSSTYVPQRGPDSTNNTNWDAYDEYLWPTDTQYISDYNLDDFDRETIVLIRNEIYARYGYNFQDDRIQSYFASQSWYYPVDGLNSTTFDTSVFNEYERENLDTILAYESAMGWR